jgi:hypothetical protein
MGVLLLIGLNYNPTAMTSLGYKPSTIAMWLSSAIPVVIIDLILLVLPLPMIWKLRIKRSRDFAVLGVFILCYRQVNSLRVSMFLPQTKTQCSYEVNVTRPTSAVLQDSQPSKNVVYVQRDISVS